MASVSGGLATADKRDSLQRRGFPPPAALCADAEPQADCTAASRIRQFGAELGVRRSPCAVRRLSRVAADFPVRALPAEWRGMARFRATAALQSRPKSVEEETRLRGRARGPNHRSRVHARRSTPLLADDGPVANGGEDFLLLGPGTLDTRISPVCRCRGTSAAPDAPCSSPYRGA